MPPVERMGKQSRLIVWQAVGDDEYAGVRIASVEETDSQLDEVISIAGHKDTTVARCIPQLRFVIKALALYLMHTDDIET